MGRLKKLTGYRPPHWKEVLPVLTVASERVKAHGTVAEYFLSLAFPACVHKIQKGDDARAWNNR